MKLGSGERPTRPSHHGVWVRTWLAAMLIDYERERYNDLRRIVDGTWYQGNLVSTLAKEDKDYIRENLPERSNPRLRPRKA